MAPFWCLSIFSLAALASLSPAAAIDIPGNNGVAAVEARPNVPTTVQFLQAHNDARAAARVPPLTWNWTLQLDAMGYAKELRVHCVLRPPPAPWSTDKTYGRNLFKGSGYQSAAAVVAAWVGERRWYDHGANACAAGKVCGDYTQVVWSGTRQLGCARRTCRSSDDTVAVCKYFPPGNYVGMLPY